MSNEELQEKFDEIIRLTKIIKERGLEGSEQIQLFLANPMLDAIINNYEQFKGNINIKVMGPMGEMIPDEFFDDLLEEMRELVGEEVEEKSTVLENIDEKLKQDEPITSPEKLTEWLEQIDTMLKQSNHSPEEIDILLDKRLEITKKIMEE